MSKNDELYLKKKKNNNNFVGFHDLFVVPENLNSDAPFFFFCHASRQFAKIYAESRSPMVEATTRFALASGGEFLDKFAAAGGGEGGGDNAVVSFKPWDGKTHVHAKDFRALKMETQVYGRNMLPNVAPLTK